MKYASQFSELPYVNKIYIYIGFKKETLDKLYWREN